MVSTSLIAFRRFGQEPFDERISYQRQVRASAVDLPPPTHSAPFDRMLVAQARIHEITLLTTDEIVARYPGPIRLLLILDPD